MWPPFIQAIPLFVILLGEMQIEKKPSHRRGDVNILLALKSPFHFFSPLLVL